MGRNIGGRIIEACEIVESFGACGSPEVTPLMGIQPTNAIKYLSRAVGYGLLTVDRDVTPHQYSAVASWRDKLKVTEIRPAPVTEGRSDGEPIVRRAMRTQPNSVFSLAGLMT